MNTVLDTPWTGADGKTKLVRIHRVLGRGGGTEPTEPQGPTRTQLNPKNPWSVWNPPGYGQNLQEMWK